MHEVQGFFCKTVNSWINAKITAAEKKHYGPNLAALLGQQRGAVGSSPMGQGPVGDAVAHAAGQGAAGPWRSSTLAGSTEEVGARSTGAV